MGHTRLFITTLPVDGFLVEDALDWGLMGVEPKTAVLCDEDVERAIPTAGAPTLSAGRNCGKLCVNGSGTCVTRPGKRMQGDELREIEWAPPKAATLLLLTPELVPEEYGRGPWAAQYAGRFGGEAFSEASKTGPCAGKPGLACGSGKSVKNMPSRERCYLCRLPNGLPEVFSERAVFGVKGQGRSRSSSQRCAPSLAQPSSVSHKPVILGPMRWVDVAGRALRRTWRAHWRRQHVEVLPLTEALPKRKPPPRPPRAVRSRHRWRGPDRLACNTGFGPPQMRISVAGVPAFLASD